MPNLVDKSEPISRYIMQRKGRYSTEFQTVKHGAFMPAPNGETSVYRILNISENDIWEIGDKFVAHPQGKKILARADFYASTVFNLKLAIQHKPTPHPRHANIIHWPKEKDKQQMLAVELANNSKLNLKK